MEGSNGRPMAGESALGDRFIAVGGRFWKGGKGVFFFSDFQTMGNEKSGPPGDH